MTEKEKLIKLAELKYHINEIKKIMEDSNFINQLTMKETYSVINWFKNATKNLK